MLKSGLRSVRSIPSLRAAKSNPDLRSNIHHSSRSTKPTNLLSSNGSVSGGNFMSLSLNALKVECRKKGLKVSGRKAELIERLTGYEASKSMSGTAFSGAAKTIKTSRPSQAKGDDSSIDYFVFNRGSFDPPQPPASMKIPVPPDSHIGVAPEVEAPVYTAPVPDGGAADDLLTKDFGKVVSLGDDSKVRTLVDDTEVTEKIVVEDEQSGSSGDGPTSKDNTFMAAFVAAVGGWWFLGKLGDKKEH